MNRVDDPDSLYRNMCFGRGVEDLFCTRNDNPPELSIACFEKMLLTARKLKRKYFDREFSVIQPNYRIDVLDRACTYKAGSRAKICVLITNNGLVALSSKYKNPVNLSYHIFKGNRKIVHDGLRTVLSSNIETSQSLTLWMDIELPTDIGIYMVQLSLVQEGFCWLYEMNPDLVFKLEVNVENH